MAAPRSATADATRRAALAPPRRRTRRTPPSRASRTSRRDGRRTSGASAAARRRRARPAAPSAARGRWCAARCSASPIPAITACLIVSLLLITLPIFGTKPRSAKKRSIDERVPEPCSRTRNVLDCERLAAGSAARARAGARRRDDHQRMVGERHRLRLDPLRRRAHDRDVDLVALELADDDLAVVHRQRDAHARVALLEPRDQRRREVLGGADDADADASAAQSLERRDRGIRVLQRVEDLLRVADQVLAGFGEMEPASAALEQREARDAPRAA